MELTQHFFVEGRYLGQGRRTAVRTDRDIYGRPCSKLFFCAVCGEVLARCPVVDDGGRVSSWHSQYAVCAKCPSSGLSIPGSIVTLEPGFVEAFPLALLQREVILQANNWKKQHEPA